MISVAFAQIRAHWARFAAIGLGIALAAGFVSATLIINTSLQESLREGIGQSFSRAGVVVMPVTGAAIDPPEVAAVTESLAGVPGVSAVEVTASAVASARGGGIADTDFAVTPAPGDPRLDTFSVVEGSRPQEPTDVVVDTATAADLGVGVGDTLRFTTATARIDTDTDSMPVYRGPRHSATDFTVVGIAEMGDDPTFVGMPRALTTGASYREHFARSGDVAAIQLGLSSDADPETVRSAIETRIADSVLRDRMETMTVDEAVDRRVAEFSEGSDFIAWMLLGCAGISVLVAVLVVSNTFSVIIAGRRRELALLRCIGASRRQLYGSVLVEGVFVGLLGSLLGVIAGIGVSALLVAVATRVWKDEFAYVSLTVPAWTLLAGVVVGVLLTVAATIRPARSAIAVTPLEALQPFDVPSAPTSQSRARVLSGWGSIVIGTLAVVLALVFAVDSPVWILVGALGGILVVVGLVLGSGQIIPPVVSWIGDLVVTPWGLPGQLATLNTLRNRRRTGSTAAALVIGVTLVSTLVVGGMSTKATFGAGLEQHFPVDVAVNLGTAADQDVIEEIRDIDGVATAVLAYHGSVVDDDAELYIVDPSSLSALLGESAPPVVAGRVTVPENYPGQSVQVQGLTTATLPVEKSGESSRAYFTPADVGNRIGISAASTAVLITLAPTRAAPTSCASGSRSPRHSTSPPTRSSVRRSNAGSSPRSSTCSSSRPSASSSSPSSSPSSGSRTRSASRSSNADGRTRCCAPSASASRSCALCSPSKRSSSPSSPRSSGSASAGPSASSRPDSSPSTSHRHSSSTGRSPPRSASSPSPSSPGSSRRWPRPVAPHGCPRSKGSSRRPDPAGSRARPQW